MTDLRIGARDGGTPATLPLDALTTAIGIIGRRGSGKTNTAVVLAEEFSAHHLPFVVLDPLGVWFGLRSSKDGAGPGLPVTILGGAHGDVPLEETAGALVAELVVEHPGSYIIDISGFASRSAERRFATDFAEKLHRLKARETSALCLIVDEADTFAPQRVQSGEERLLGAFEAIARRGRARGLGMVMITQRPAVLNKNLLSQVECLIAMQITAPQDREALKAWAQGNADKATVDTFLASLAPLKTGQAWLWSPSWLERFERVDIRARQTFDSSATPKAGELKVEPKVLAPVDLDALRDKMAATIEKAAAEDPKRLRARIATLERELSTLRNERKVEPCDHEEEIERLAYTNRALTADLSNLEAKVAHLEQRLWEIPAFIEAEALRLVNEITGSPVANNGASSFKSPAPAAREGVKHAQKETQNGASTPPPRPVHPLPKRDTESGAELTRPQQRILDAIAAFEPLGITSIAKNTIAVYAGASSKSSAYTNNLGNLRTAGLVDYPQKGHVRLTAAGRAQASEVEPIWSVRQLQDAWLRKLPAPRARIIQALIDLYPQDVDKAELAGVVEASAASSAYTNNLGGLRSLGLLKYPSPGRVIATSLLFPEGVPQ